MFRNKVLYFMILAEVCLLVVLYNAYQPVVLLWIVLLLPVMLKILVFVTGLFVKVKVTDEHIIVTRQSTCKIEVELENTSVLPSGQVMLFGNVDGKNFQCKGNFSSDKKLVLEYPVECNKCGVRTVNLTKIYLFDLLKITKKVIKLNRQLTITVIPKIYYIEENNLDENVDYEIESNTFSENVPGQDPSEIFDVRDYREGDRLSRIHWKLSGKLDRLMVKEYSKPMLEGVELIIDTDFAEDNVDAVFSVGMHVIEKKGIAWVNKVKTTITDEYIEEFIKAIKQHEKAKLFEELAGRVGAENCCKIVCCVDSVDVGLAALLNQAASTNKIYLVCEQISRETEMELSKVVLCRFSEMDVVSVIERIINE